MTATTARRRGRNRPTSKLDIRPGKRPARFKHDTFTVVDAFSGFGGMTQGAKAAGGQLITAANHNPYKVEVHEANNPEADHYVCDLVDTDSPAYWNAADLPPALLFMAGISCKHQSQANAKKAYAEGLNLFSLHDPEWEERVTRSERDRATAICVLQYAEAHHPLLMIIECTTELVSWGPQIPGRKNIGDGSTYRWWLNETRKLGYRHRALYLNSQFFGVPQSRDRIYLCFWDDGLQEPDLEIRPLGICPRCDRATETVWQWRTGIPPSGRVRYGEQYHYVCPRCSTPVRPKASMALEALDLSDLGPKLGDRKKPLKPASMARAERCRQRLPEFPLVLMPAKTARGTERHAWQPMATQTSQQETALLSAGGILKVAGNAYERPGSQCRSRPLDQPLWTQSATEETALLTSIVPYRQGNQPRGVGEAIPTIAANETTALLSAGVVPLRTHGTPRAVDEPMQTLVAGAGSGGIGVLSAGVAPYRQHTIPTRHDEPMPTFTADQSPALLTAAGFIKHNGDAAEAKYRAHPIDSPLGTVTASAATQAVLFSGWYKQNGSTGTETAPHGVDEPLGTITSKVTTGLLTARLRDQLAALPLEEHHYRMLFPWEHGRGCGFDPDFRDHKGTFVVWGSARDQVDGYGNAVSPSVSELVARRMVAVL